jgi:hypothetical protein
VGSCVIDGVMVVVVNCDISFIFTMVFINSFCYLTREKKNACAKQFLVTAKKPNYIHGYYN